MTPIMALRQAAMNARGRAVAPLKKVASGLEHPIVKLVVLIGEVAAIGVAIWAGVVAKQTFDDQRLLSAYQILTVEQSSAEARWAAASVVMTQARRVNRFSVPCDFDDSEVLMASCVTLEGFQLIGADPPRGFRADNISSPGTRMFGARVENGTFGHGDLRGLYVSEGIFRNLQFGNISLARADLSLEPSVLAGANRIEEFWYRLTHGHLFIDWTPTMEFTAVNLTNATIAAGDLSGVDIEFSNISGLKLYGKLARQQFRDWGNYYFEGNPPLTRDGVSPGLADFVCPAELEPGFLAAGPFDTSLCKPITHWGPMLDTELRPEIVVPEHGFAPCIGVDALGDPRCAMKAIDAE